MLDNLNYESAGVSIETANDTKKKFKDMVSSQGFSHCTPINKVGAFASLVEIDIKKYENPVFVLKSEEPGSKQMLSIENGRIEWIAQDLIHHLVNDIIVMGAMPCAVLDTIICGKFEKETVLKLVGEISKACIENNCILVGGETSEQPGMLQTGRYVLQASVLGIVDKSKIIDGSQIKNGDNIIALASNGLFTNGYSLVRKLIETKPEILNETINGESFLENILKPHISYSNAIHAVLDQYFDSIHGMAHITGGGIHDNLIRIMQNENLQANIDLSLIKTLPVFHIIKKYANTTDGEMLKTFNNGVGLIIVANDRETDLIINKLKEKNAEAYCIGQISQSDNNKNDKKVIFYNQLNWDFI